MITITFWACLISSGVCSEQRTWVRVASPMACVTAAPEETVAEWLAGHPDYAVKADATHPITCKPREERAA